MLDSNNRIFYRCRGFAHQFYDSCIQIPCQSQIALSIHKYFRHIVDWGNSPKHNGRVPAQLRHESTFPRSLQTAFMPTQSRRKTFFHMPIAFSNRHLFPVAKAARPCSANRLHARLGGEPREHPRLIGKSIVQLIHGTDSETSHLLTAPFCISARIRSTGRISGCTPFLQITHGDLQPALAGGPE